jgi:hypothetical protein
MLSRLQLRGSIGGRGVEWISKTGNEISASLELQCNELFFTM